MTVESVARIGKLTKIGGSSVFWGGLALLWASAELRAGLRQFTGSVPPPIDLVVQHLPELALGAKYTVAMTAASIGVGFLVAVPVSLARRSNHPLRFVSHSYTELVRGTPLLAQLFFLYYGLPLLSAVDGFAAVLPGPFSEPAVLVAIIGFSINSSAYQAEYFRSAFRSIEKGQEIAALSLGLSRAKRLRYVVLPQVLRYALPSWTNELVYLIKYTAIASFITVPELFYRTEGIAVDNFEFTVMFGISALLYLGIVLTATFLMSAIEASYSVPGIGRDQTLR